MAGKSKLTERIPCDFMIVRYVPDVVRGEFINIGVILRAFSAGSEHPSVSVRFTDNWSRVRCMDNDADINCLVSLEDDLISRFQLEHVVSVGGAEFKPILDQFLESLSNSIVICDPRACLAEDPNLELDRLMTMYVDSASVVTDRAARPPRDLIHDEMRRQFKDNQVWHLMTKGIKVAVYTKPGDPMKIDCGYRYKETIRLFQAISLRSTENSAKSIAYSVTRIAAGVKRIHGSTIQLTAIIEPLRRITILDAEQEAGEHYRYCVDAMEEEGITVLTTNALAEPARIARLELIASST